MQSELLDISQFNNLDEVINALAQYLDERQYEQEADVNSYLEIMRHFNSECADLMEKELYQSGLDGRYGIGASGFLKINIIRPIQKRYKE